MLFQCTIRQNPLSVQISTNKSQKGVAGGTNDEGDLVPSFKGAECLAPKSLWQRSLWWRKEWGWRLFNTLLLTIHVNDRPGGVRIGDKFCLMINFKKVRWFRLREKFKIEGLHVTPSLLQKGKSTINFHVEAACRAVSVHEEPWESLLPTQWNNIQILWPFTGHTHLHQNQRSYRGKIVPTRNGKGRQFLETVLQPMYSQAQLTPFNTFSSTSLYGCCIKQSWNVFFPARGTHLLDTGRIPGSARILSTMIRELLDY